MARSKDYVPSRDVDFLNWAKNLVGYAMANYQRWGVIDPKDMLEMPLAEFETRMQNALLPDSGVISKRTKNEARVFLERALRAYVQGFLARNPLVNTDDRGELRLPVYDRTPTAVTDPLGQAEVSIKFVARTQLMVQIKHSEGSPFDKRANYGCRVYYSVYAAGDTPPANGKDLRESMFTRRKKEVFTFQPEDSGKTAYFSVRYENSKGKAGPWGPMGAAIVP